MVGSYQKMANSCKILANSESFKILGVTNFPEKE
jgi:hypothetical protein